MKKVSERRNKITKERGEDPSLFPPLPFTGKRILILMTFLSTAIVK